MKINIDKLKINITEYNKLVEEYENICQNYYYELESDTNYWSSPYANYFFSLIAEEKKENKKFYQELSSLTKIFNYLILKYESLGSKINFDEKNKDTILNKINNYKIDDIINIYDNLDLSFCPQEKNLIEKQKTKLQTTKVNINKYKKNIKNYFSTIEEIENQIKLKLSKLTISPIKENSLLEHKLGNTEEILMDINQIENSVKKLQMYKEQEEINLENLKEIFNNIKYNYITNNKDTLEDIELDIILKYKIIINNNHNNIKILNINIERFKTAKTEMENILNNVNINSKE